MAPGRAQAADRRLFTTITGNEHNITVDLKTTEKLPSAVKVPHARQVALYVTTNNADARASYVTPKKRATYRIDNIDEHRQALHQIALRCEKFLALSDDPAFFTKITAPDFESFYWGGPARQIAFETWGF
jgi:ABC-type molybdate transport system substrate-binding protein